MINLIRSPKSIIQVDNEVPGPGTYYEQKIKDGSATTSSFFASKMKRQLSYAKPSSNLGPGQYIKVINQPSINKNISRKVLKSSLSKSIKQDPHHKKIQTNLFKEEVNDIMKQNQDQNQQIGKLIGIKQKKQWKQKLKIQVLPSIPSQEQSFGYKYDEEYQKLVNNINPKILFSCDLKIGSEKDFIFQKTQKQQKIIGTTLTSFAQRFKPQNSASASFPNPMSYSSQKYNSIGSSIKNKANPTMKSHQNINLKNIDILKLSKLKRQYREYIERQGITLQDLSQMQKNKNFLSKQNLLKNKGKQNQKQFFLSKQQRFKVRKLNIQRKSDKKEILLQQNVINQKKQDEKAIKKQIFTMTSQRFKEKAKQNLGPGTYDISSIKDNRSALINQNEKRFNNEAHLNTPGPGSYSPENTVITSNDQRRVKQEKKYANMFALKHQRSMSSLYEEVGKQVNYFQKVFKYNNKAQNCLNLRSKKSQEKPKDHCQIIKEVQKIVQNDLLQKKYINHTAQKQIRINKPLNLKHMYEYHNLANPPSDLGPGHYQLRKTFNRKTFNKTLETFNMKQNIIN